jgi:diketogulonate reductase-like aldo/keto reductase
VFPIVGGRKIEHLKQNIQALDISLSPEQIQRIDSAKPFDVGFPYTLIVRPIYIPCASLAEHINREIAQ